MAEIKEKLPLIITNLDKLRMKQANAAQKRWMKQIADFIEQESLGILYGSEFEGRKDFQLHHVLGRSAKHNKVAIGHWFIIPVPIELHDVHSNHPDNVTHFKKNFVKRFGEQCGIFQCMISCMVQWGYTKEFNNDVYNAIMDTNA